MKVQQWLLTAALVAVPALAVAQTTTTTAPDTTTTTQTQTTTTTRTNDVDFDDLDNDTGGWFAAAHVGSDFGEEADGSSVEFGGALGYTIGWFGAEFLAGFTPNFQLRNNIFLDEPQINSYMFNLMAGVPIGADKNWQPFVSGGLGAMTLRSDSISGDDSEFEEAFEADDTKLGANAGFGLMGFAGNVGIRADVRYFRAFSNDEVEDALDLDPGTIDSGNALASTVLSGLDFWRANIGLAFRW
jgi:hypothetical protein